MPRSIFYPVLFSVLLLLTSLAFAFAGTPAPSDVDITAPDGIKLRATFFAASNIAASKPGPWVLLLHMCNTAQEIVGTCRARTEPIWNQYAHHR